jgi:DHA1 family tetracycline resistance protein-like MFS transporter
MKPFEPKATSEATPHMRGRWPIAVLMLAVVMNTMGFGVVMPLLPFYAMIFKAPAWQITLLFAVYSLGQFTGELYWGRLSDRIGRRPVLIATTFCMALSYVALAAAPTILVAMLIRTAAGFFSGSLSTIQGYIVDRSTPAEVPGRLGVVAATYSTGFVIGPVIGGLLAIPNGQLSGFHPPLAACAVMGMTALAGILAFVREPTPPRARSSPAVRKGSFHQGLDATIVRLLGTTLVSYTAWSAMIATLGLWGHERFQWGTRELGLVIALTGIAAAISQGIITRAAASRLGEVITVTGGLLLTSSALAIQATSPWQSLALICLLLAGIGHMGVQPCIASLVSRAAPLGTQGTLLGANVAGGALGRVVGPILAGFIFTTFGSRGPLLFASLAILPAVWLVVSSRRDVAD